MNWRGSVFPCFLCGNGVKIKESKNGKPCFICDPCGLQVFVRRKLGIKKLKEILRVNEGVDFGLCRSSGILLEVTSLVNRHREIRRKLEEFEGKQGFFNQDEALRLAGSALGRELEDIEKQLRLLDRGGIARSRQKEQ